MSTPGCQSAASRVIAASTVRRQAAVADTARRPGAGYAHTIPEALFAIRPRVRRAVVDVLASLHVDCKRIVQELGSRRGFATVGELFEFLGDLYGLTQEQCDAGYLAPSGTPAGRSSNVAVRRDLAVTSNPESVLVAIPDGLFIDAIQFGVEQAAQDGPKFGRSAERVRETFQARVGELFLANGTPYRFEAGELVASMSPSASAASIQPSMDALDDPRLTDARVHFREALRRLEEPDPDEAVDEARMAVEAALFAVLDVTPTAPEPSRRQPQQLFDALAEVIGREAEELVLATPRFRGRTSAGHSGGTPVTLREAQAAVAGAAAALLYLVSKMP